MKAKAILALSILAAIAGTTPARAQAQEPPPLSQANIVKPDKPTHALTQKVELVATKPLTINRVINQISGSVENVGESLPGDTIALEARCPSKAGFPLPIPVDKECAIHLTRKADLPPGLYTANLSLIDSGGAKEQAAVEFAVRRGAGAAIALVVLGLILGIVITSWRGSGRGRARSVIAVKEAIEALTLLDSGNPGRRIEPILARGRELEYSLLRNATVEPAELSELSARVSQYRFVLVIEEQGDSLPDDKKAILAAAVRDSIDAMLPGASGKLAAVPEEVFTALKAKVRELQASQVQTLDSAGDSGAPDLPLPITRAMSSRTARLAFAATEWVVTLILMAIFATVALGTLYFNDPTWGSPADLLAAFMIGFGAYAGAAAGVDSFLQRARTVPS